MSVDVKTFMKLDGEFVPMAEFSGPVTDPEHVEGAVELKINGKMISSTNYWDDIDVLWDLIIQGLEDLRRGESFCMFWPDQPIKLTMEPLGSDNIIVGRYNSSDPDVEVIVDKGELFDELLRAAYIFFEYLSRLVSANEVSEILCVIEDLREWRRREAGI